VEVAGIGQNPADSLFEDLAPTTGQNPADALFEDLAPIQQGQRSGALEASLKALQDLPTGAYVYGGKPGSKAGTDCSGAMCVLAEQHGLKLPRTAKAIFQDKRGQAVSKEQLQPGDLVFFGSPGPSGWHVGFYQGNGKFLHQSSDQKPGLSIGDLNRHAAKHGFKGAKRFNELAAAYGRPAAIAAAARIPAQPRTELDIRAGGQLPQPDRGPNFLRDSLLEMQRLGEILVALSPQARSIAARVTAEGGGPLEIAHELTRVNDSRSKAKILTSGEAQLFRSILTTHSADLARRIDQDPTLGLDAAPAGVTGPASARTAIRRRVGSLQDDPVGALVGRASRTAGALAKPFEGAGRSLAELSLATSGMYGALNDEERESFRKAWEEGAPIVAAGTVANVATAPLLGGLTLADPIAIGIGAAIFGYGEHDPLYDALAPGVLRLMAPLLKAAYKGASGPARKLSELAERADIPAMRRILAGEQILPVQQKAFGEILEKIVKRDQLARELRKAGKSAATTAAARAADQGFAGMAENFREGKFYPRALQGADYPSYETPNLLGLAKGTKPADDAAARTAESIFEDLAPSRPQPEVTATAPASQKTPVPDKTAPGASIPDQDVDIGPVEKFVSKRGKTLYRVKRAGSAHEYIGETPQEAVAAARNAIDRDNRVAQAAASFRQAPDRAAGHIEARGFEIRTRDSSKQSSSQYLYVVDPSDASRFLDKPGERPLLKVRISRHLQPVHDMLGPDYARRPGFASGDGWQFRPSEFHPGGELDFYAGEIDVAVIDRLLAKTFGKRANINLAPTPSKSAGARALEKKSAPSGSKAERSSNQPRSEGGQAGKSGQTAPPKALTETEPGGPKGSPATIPDQPPQAQSVPTATKTAQPAPSAPKPEAEAAPTGQTTPPAKPTRAAARKREAALANLDKAGRQRFVRENAGVLLARRADLDQLIDPKSPKYDPRIERALFKAAKLNPGESTPREAADRILREWQEAGNDPERALEEAQNLWDEFGAEITPSLKGTAGAKTPDDRWRWYKRNGVWVPDTRTTQMIRMVPQSDLPAHIQSALQDYARSGNYDPEYILLGHEAHHSALQQTKARGGFTWDSAPPGARRLSEIVEDGDHYPVPFLRSFVEDMGIPTANPKTHPDFSRAKKALELGDDELPLALRAIGAKEPRKPPEPDFSAGPTKGREIIWNGKKRSFHDAEEEWLYDLLDKETRGELRALEKKFAAEQDPVAKRRLQRQIAGHQRDRINRLNEFWADHDARALKLERQARGDDLDQAFLDAIARDDLTESKRVAATARRLDAGMTQLPFGDLKQLMEDLTVLAGRAMRKGLNFAKWSAGIAQSFGRKVRTLALISWRRAEALLDGEGPVLTEFDSRVVRRARRLARERPSTHVLNDSARKVLRANVEKALYGDGAARRQRQATIIIGPSASGKSRLATQAVNDTGALLIDADEAKKLLPEFEAGKGADLVHVESADIAEGPLLRRAMRAGDNIVLPMVGKTAEKALRLVKGLQRQGYDVHLKYIRMAPRTAAKAAVERFERTGRFVDPNYVLNDVGTKPERTYGILKTEGGLKSYEAYEARPGKAPLLREASAAESGPETLRRDRGRQGPGDTGKPAGKKRRKESGFLRVLSDTKPGTPERLQRLGKALQKAILKATSQVYAGAPPIDSETLEIALQYGLELYRHGTQRFGEWSKAMLEGASDSVRKWLEPRLKSIHRWAARAHQEGRVPISQQAPHLDRVKPQDLKDRKIQRGLRRSLKYFLLTTGEAAAEARDLLASARGRGEDLVNTVLDVEEALLRQGAVGNKAVRIVEKGFFDSNGKQTAKGLTQMRREMREQGFDYDAWAKYRTALRENEIAARGGIPEDRFAANEEFIVRYLDEHGDAAAAWDIEWQNFADEALWLYERYGLKNDDWVRQIREENALYFPLHTESTAVDATMRTLNPQSVASPMGQVYRAIGGGKYIDAFAAMAMEIEKVVRHGELNQALLPFFDEAADHKSLEFLAKELDPPQRMTPEEADPFETLDEFSDTYDFFESFKKKPIVEGQSPVLTLYDGGRARRFAIDPYLWDAIRGQQPHAVSEFLALMRAFARIARGGTTRYNPFFSFLFNPMIDIASGMIQHGMNPIRWAQGVRSALKQDANYNLALESNAMLDSKGWRDLMEQEWIYDPKNRNLAEQVGDNLAERQGIRILKAGMAGYERLADAFEQAARIGYFNQRLNAYQKAGRVAEDAQRRAAADARNLMNFSEAGAIGRLMVSLGTPFANIPFQVLQSIGRGYQRNPKLFIARGIGFLTIPALIEYALYKDDPDWQRLPDYVKYGGLNFKVAGSWYSIRIPMELGVVFKAIPMLALDVAQGEKGKQEAVAHELANIADAYSPPLLPTAAAAALQQIWYGAVGQGGDGLPGTGGVIDVRFFNQRAYPITQDSKKKTKRKNEWKQIEQQTSTLLGSGGRYGIKTLGFFLGKEKKLPSPLQRYKPVPEKDRTAVASN
jgi:hypothetical protein